MLITSFSIFPNLTLYDYKSIEDNLTKMAAEGWRTESIGPFLWKFKRSTPSNKKFSVLFVTSDSGHETSSIEKEKSFEDICAKEGWEEEYRWKDMHIYAANPDAMPLETDEIKLKSIHKNMKKTLIPSGIYVIIFMLLMAFTNGMKYFGNSPYVDEKTIWAVLINLFGALLVGASLLGYLFWFKFSKEKISKGGTCISIKWYRKLQIVLIIVFLAICIGVLLY